MTKDTRRRAGAVILAASLAGMVLLTGCASNAAYETVPSATAGRSQSVSEGTVIGVRKVNIEGEATHVGHTSGTIGGAAVGQTVGRGSGRTLATAGGAIVGGIVGGQIEKAITAKVGQEITIELDDGYTIVVVQERTEPEFREGDRVSVLETLAGYSRVRHSEFSAQAF